MGGMGGMSAGGMSAGGMGAGGMGMGMGAPNMAHFASSKKQREVYVGNLTVGLVTPQMLRDLCNGALAPYCSDAATNPPVVNVSMDAEGKYSFVEMRTEELATAALHLDKVELCGRNINVGRPKGYIDPALAGAAGVPGLPPGIAPAAIAPAFHGFGPSGTPGLLGASAMPGMPGGAALDTMPGAGGSMGTPGGATALGMLGMAAGSAPATCCLYLENMVRASELVDDTERDEIIQDVREECAKYGQVVSVCVPRPPDAAVAADEAGRVFVKFDEQAGAIGAQRALHGRTFGGNKVVGQFVSEADMDAAERGEWVTPTPPAAAAPAEGVIKLRGLPFTASKQDIVVFFHGFGLEETGVKIVMGFDGRPSGEAYAIFEGPNADVRGALSKDRQILGSRYVELFLVSKDELDRRALTGTIMV